LRLRDFEREKSKTQIPFGDDNQEKLLGSALLQGFQFVEGAGPVCSEEA
jgi:hypothetical protein